jgi:hypothetical protein
MSVVTSSIGELGSLSSIPYASLNDLQKWARSQEHESDKSRENPALRDMHSVYELLVSSASHSGATIRLAPGCNVAGLDEQRRRFLVPGISKEILHEIRKAPTASDARKASRVKGAVQYHWSVERTGLVPNPKEMHETLPLPERGAYMIMYAAPVAVVGKKPFIKAITEFAAVLPLLDVLVWDTSAPPPTLWSLRGGFGHCGGDDIEWSDELAESAALIKAVF